eukprot:g3547.t1
MTNRKSCEPGTYQEKPQKASCKQCPEGYSKLVNGGLLNAALCIACGKGEYSDDTYSCSQCPSGKYQDKDEMHGMDSCKDCPYGWQSAEASPECYKEASTDVLNCRPDLRYMKVDDTTNSSNAAAATGDYLWKFIASFDVESCNSKIVQSDATDGMIELEWLASKSANFVDGDGAIASKNFGRVQQSFSGVGKNTTVELRWDAALLQTPWHGRLFVRARMDLNGTKSLWSQANLPWDIAEDCGANMYLSVKRYDGMPEHIGGAFGSEEYLPLYVRDDAVGEFTHGALTPECRREPERSSEFMDAQSEKLPSYAGKFCGVRVDCKRGVTWDDVIPLRGYWRASRLSTNIYQCRSGYEACTGACVQNRYEPACDRGSNTSAGSTGMPETREGCNSDAGYEGMLCEFCAKEFFKRSGRCIRCSFRLESSNTGTVVAMVACCTLLLLVLFIMCGPKRCLSSASEYRHILVRDIGRMTKLLANFLQVVTSIGSVYSVEIPPSIIRFFRNFDFVNFDVFGVLRVDCLRPLRWFESFAGMLVILLCYMSLVFLLYIFLRQRANQNSAASDDTGWKRVQWLKQHKLLKQGRVQRSDSVDLEFLAQKMLFMNHSQHKASTIRLRARCLSAVFYVVMLAHMPVTSKAFMLFQCRWIEFEGTIKPYMAADLQVVCYESEWSSYLLIVLACIIGYTCLFPMMILFILARNRKRLQSPKVLVELGFLFMPYRLKAYMWEVVILLRKVLLCGIAVIMYASPVMQISYGIIVQAFFHVMHAEWEPYHDRWVNILEHVVLSATSLTFLGCLVTHALRTSAAGTAEGEDLASAFVITSNTIAIFMVICGALLSVVLSIRNSIRLHARLKVNDGKKQDLNADAESATKVKASHPASAQLKIPKYQRPRRSSELHLDLNTVQHAVHMNQALKNLDMGMQHRIVHSSKVKEKIETSRARLQRRLVRRRSLSEDITTTNALEVQLSHLEGGTTHSAN